MYQSQNNINQLLGGYIHTVCDSLWYFGPYGAMGSFILFGERLNPDVPIASSESTDMPYLNGIFTVYQVVYPYLS